MREQNTKTAIIPLWRPLREGPLKICIIGGGNWATVISRIIAKNAAESYIFDNTVHMWIHDETWEGQSLTWIINNKHENPKYLPGIKLPQNLKAVAQLDEHVNAADLLVFVLPHQYAESVCQSLAGKTKSTAQAISLIKGIKVEQSKPVLFSSIIEKHLGIPCAVLSGANIANEIAREEFATSTLGYKPENRENAAVWQQLFDVPYFKVTGIPDICGVEVSGALKNIIALAVGFSDALGSGNNTKAALIRQGVEEIRVFSILFFNEILEETFCESAGYADVITTCFGGRNVRCAAEFARREGKDSWDQIEAEMLKGQKLQGQLTCHEVFQAIEYHQLFDIFPLFTITYRISFQGLQPSALLTSLVTSKYLELKYANECSPSHMSDQIKFYKDLVRTRLNN